MRSLTGEVLAQSLDPGARQAETQEAESMGGLAPLYVASLIVSLCGIGAVSATIADSVWTQRCVFFTCVGHGASYFLRRRNVSHQLLFLATGLVAVIALVYEAFGGRGSLTAPAAGLPPDMGLASLISWLVVIRSFTLVTNGSLLFSCVPALATLGLTASSNPNSEIPILFCIFVFGTIFMALYEQHVARATIAPGPAASLTWHLSTALVIFLLALGAGTLIGLAGARAFSPLSPYALPTLGKLQANVPTFMTGPQNNGGPIRVGSGPIQLSSDPVFDIYTPEPGLWRIGAMEDYDGRGWYPIQGTRQLRLVAEEAAAPIRPRGTSVNVRGPLYRFAIEPSLFQLYPLPTHRVDQLVVVKTDVTPQLPVLDRPVEVRFPERQLLFQPRDGALLGRSFFSRDLAFEITSEVPEYPADRLRAARPGSDVRGLVGERCLAVPITAPRLKALAEQITAGKNNDYDRVQAVLHHIEGTCTYSLMEDPTPEGEDAVEHYLFTSRVGACDLAASAAVLLCRSANIPSRAVTGYVAGEPLPDGGPGYQVRQMDAHMWLEVFFPGYGWVPFNPSPPSSNLEPDATGRVMQRFHALLNFALRGSLDTYLLIIVSGFLLFTLGRSLKKWAEALLRGWREERAILAEGGPASLAIIYRRMDRHLRRAGWRRDPTMTPNEFLGWLAAQWGTRAPAMEAAAQITERFVQAWYGGVARPGALDEARRALDSLRRCLPRRRRRKGQTL
jgi:transglutaminase-like putative cysteine protease